MTNVLGICLLSIAPHISAHRGPGDSPADRGDALTASSNNLVAENAADDGADNCTLNVRTASLLRDLLAVDPTPLLGGTEHGTRRGDIRLVQPLAVAST
ncbi:MAG: hypothetical protein WAL83_14170, partial [Arenicellales bacterium]